MSVFRRLDLHELFFIHVICESYCHWVTCDKMHAVPILSIGLNEIMRPEDKPDPTLIR